jgi:hypothetical protein
MALPLAATPALVAMALKALPFLGKLKPQMINKVLQRGQQPEIPNLLKLAEQEGKFGTQLRTLQPMGKNVSGNFELIRSKIGTGGVPIESRKFKTINDAMKALERMQANKGEIIMGPRQLK